MSGSRRWLAVALGAAAGLAAPAAATAQDGGTASVRGMVFDSTTMQALAGARVALLGASDLVETDEDGRFELAEVPAGTWWISFYHPRLQELGVSPPSRQLEVTEGGEVSVDLALPSETTLVANWCLTEQPGGGYGALAGVVTDSLTGVPMPKALVSVEVNDALAVGTAPIEATTDDAGYYRICSVPAGIELTVRASFGKNEGPTETVAVPDRGARLEDLHLIMTGEGTLAGQVLDYASGKPVAGASVTVLGVPSPALTDERGRFVQGALPPGRHLVVTEGLGYEQRTDSVTIFSEETVDIEVRMAAEALEVEGLVVTARSRYGETTRRSLPELGRRADIMTRPEIEKLLTRVESAADLLRHMNVPGLTIKDMQVREANGTVRPFLCVEVGRRQGGGNCSQASIYLNEVRLALADQYLPTIDPNTIERIEVLTPLDAQFRFGTVAGNGAVVFYTFDPSARREGR